MTSSEYGTEGVNDEVLGVLTGQVPVRSMPITPGGSSVCENCDHLGPDRHTCGSRGIMCKTKDCYRYDTHTHDNE